ncbi:MAG TPA: MFS transporter [Solirubrobacteraceae bacterium]
MLPTRTHLPRLPRLPGDRRFALLLLSLAVSACGDWLYNVALLAVVFERTHSASLLALTTAARLVPMVVLGPLGGVLAHRYDRRHLIIASDLARALLMVALAAVALTGLPIILAPAIAAAATAAGVVHPPCVAASTARLVAEDELQRASVARAAIGQTAIVVGPALGALILLVASPAAAIALNGLTFLASATAVTAIAAQDAFRPTVGIAATNATSVLGDMRAGASALRGAPTAIRLTAAEVLCSAVAGLVTVTLVLVGRKTAGTSGYGLLLGAIGAGGVTGAMGMARIEATDQWRRILAAGLLLVAISLAALGLATNLLSALALAFLLGGGMIVSEVLSETALPRLLDDAVLSRAYGLAYPAAICGIVAGSLIAAPLVALLGLTGTLVAAGSCVLLVAALLLHHPLAMAVGAYGRTAPAGAEGGSNSL